MPVRTNRPYGDAIIIAAAALSLTYAILIPEKTDFGERIVFQGLISAAIVVLSANYHRSRTFIDRTILRNDLDRKASMLSSRYGDTVTFSLLLFAANWFLGGVLNGIKWGFFSDVFYLCPSGPCPDAPFPDQQSVWQGFIRTP